MTVPVNTWNAFSVHLYDGINRLQGLILNAQEVTLRLCLI